MLVLGREGKQRGWGEGEGRSGSRKAGEVLWISYLTMVLLMHSNYLLCQSDLPSDVYSDHVIQINMNFLDI